MAAKNNASEKALRDIIIQRMALAPKALTLKPPSDVASVGGEYTLVLANSIFRDLFARQINKLNME